MAIAVAAPWAPACMDADELADWEAMRDRSTATKDRAAIPCAGCTLGYAAEMRSAGTCNGTPRGVEDDEPMDLPEPITPRRPASRLTPEVSPPPCGSCLHEPVCALRASVEGMTTIETATPPLPAGLRLALVATVECDHFLRDRAKPAPVRVLTSQERGQANGAAAYRTGRRQTPEHRANIAAGQQRAREKAAQEKAAREAATV